MFSVTYVTTASVEGDGYGTRRPPPDHRRCRARRSRRRHRHAGESSRTRYRSGRRAAHLQPRRYRPDHGALATPDPQSALFDLLNSPANIADATLNGEFVDGTTPEIFLDRAGPGHRDGTRLQLPNSAMDTVSPLDDLLSTLTTARSTATCRQPSPVLPPTSAHC